MKRLLLFTISVFLLISYSSAQSSLEDIVMYRVKEKVEELCTYITLMSDKSKSMQTRKDYMDKALSSFLFKGNAFTKDSIKHQGMMVDIVDADQGGNQKMPVKAFFRNIVNLRYDKIEVKSLYIFVRNVQPAESAGNLKFNVPYDLYCLKSGSLKKKK